jgi:hypothetical protein
VIEGTEQNREREGKGEGGDYVSRRDRETETWAITANDQLVYRGEIETEKTTNT